MFSWAGSEEGGTTIFIKGFDRNHAVNDTYDEIRAVFEQCGEIVRISLPKDYESGGLRGFGYIEFTTAEAKVRPSTMQCLSPSMLFDRRRPLSRCPGQNVQADGWSWTKLPNLKEEEVVEVVAVIAVEVEGLDSLAEDVVVADLDVVHCSLYYISALPHKS